MDSWRGCRSFRQSGVLDENFGDATPTSRFGVTLYDTYGMVKLVRNDDVAFSPGLDGGRSVQIVNLGVCISRWLRDADGKDTRERETSETGPWTGQARRECT